jgi:thiamine biosynthesis lipoprotein
MTGRSPERAVKISRGDGCWRGQFNAMASPCEVLCKTKHAADATHLAELAANEVWRIEDKFSRYRDDNIVARINSAAGSPVDVDTETAHLLDFAVTLFDISNGRFDITSGVLRQVWTFDGSSNLPTDADVVAVLERVGWQKVLWKDQRLQLHDGMEIDLGGIGKEYAVDRATGMLRDASASSCLVNLGGDLAVSRRSADEQPWTVGIEATNAGADVPAGLLKLHVGALATSGDARRYLLKDGVRYSHILDANCGRPVANAPRSITVAADTCTQAGMLSTLGMLKGSAAETFLQAQEVNYWCER